MGLPSFVFTRWQTQFTEREHAQQVFKTRFYFNTCCSDTNTQRSQEFIQNLLFILITVIVDLDGSMWFRYQMILCNLITFRCPLPSDCPPKSIQRSPLSQPVNLGSSLHLVTTLDPDEYFTVDYFLSHRVW